MLHTRRAVSNRSPAGLSRIGVIPTASGCVIGGPRTELCRPADSATLEQLPAVDVRQQNQLLTLTGGVVNRERRHGPRRFVTEFLNAM